MRGLRLLGRSDGLIEEIHAIRARGRAAPPAGAAYPWPRRAICAGARLTAGIARPRVASELLRPQSLDVGREQDHRIVVVVALLSAATRAAATGTVQPRAPSASRSASSVFECRLADDRPGRRPVAEVSFMVGSEGLAARAGGTAECRPAG